MDKMLLGMKVEKETYDAIDKRAAEMGITKTEFFRRAVDMLLNYDQTFLDIIDQYKRLGLPEYLVIQNLIITAEAERAARDEACGKERRIYTEFAMTDDGYLTGAELFAEMKQEAIRKAKFKEATHD